MPVLVGTIVGSYLSFVISHSFIRYLSIVICHWEGRVVSRADELEDRLIDFAVRIINLANALPDSPAAKHIARQLLRSGTSPAPNYAEARGAESNADFVHKLKIALKELNETSVWMKMVCRAKLMKTQLMEELIDENQQLCKILNSSSKTAREKPNRAT